MTVSMQCVFSFHCGFDIHCTKGSLNFLGSQLHMTMRHFQGHFREQAGTVLLIYILLLMFLYTVLPIETCTQCFC